MCESFPGRLPTEIWQETQRLPIGFLDDVVEARAYMSAYRIYKNAKSKADLPTDAPMVDLVRDVTFAIAADELKKRRG